MKRIDTLGYPILIGEGLLGRACDHLPSGRLFLVTDENVTRLGWPDRIGADFAGRFVLPPGESSKTLAQAERLIDALIETGIARTDHVVALGGGVVGDIAGFAAAVMKRGCAWIAMPTTLLAQADSAIGGKTGVNARQGKNLIGAFHSPALVLIDPAALETLPEREMRAGYAEVAKYGLIGDESFFEWCEENGAALIAGDATARLRAVTYCAEAKAGLVADDELDMNGRRALLNFGHSFGHAIEAETGLLHGEAVAIGMVLALRLSRDLGLCAGADIERVAAHFDRIGLPTAVAIEPARVLARMAHDKKPSLVLTRGIGRALPWTVSLAELAEFLERECGRPLSGRIGG